MSKATIVSICPFPIREQKPGVVGGYFVLPAVKEGEFITKVIDESFWVHRIPTTNQQIKVPEHAEVLAKSIVEDFKNTHVASAEDAYPGLFWLPGEVSDTEVKTKHADKLAQIRATQRNWFQRLVQAADDDWNKYHQSGLITTHQRYACNILKLERDWNTDYDPTSKLKPCPACKTDINPDAIICPNCRAILNRAEAEKYGLVEPTTIFKAPTTQDAKIVPSQVK